MSQILTQTPPANRVILSPISWQTYQKLVSELRENYHQRLAYIGGYLEIMIPLAEHENNNRFIDDLIRAIADELNLNLEKQKP